MSLYEIVFIEKNKKLYKLYKNKKILSNIVDNVSNEKIAFDSEMQKLNQL